MSWERIVTGPVQARALVSGFQKVQGSDGSETVYRIGWNL